LNITSTQILKAGDEDEIDIRYEGIPADGLIISKNKYGHRTFFSDNWPNRAHNWLPCVDNPADKASVEFLITAPIHYRVISNGEQIEETNLSNSTKLTHWKEDVPLPTKIMVIGAADFAVNLAGIVNCIPVYSWVYPENRDKGFYDYAIATDILSWYIKNIGPYPYKKLANVQSKTIFGGMENASAIFYSEDSIDGKRTSEALMAHEIAHQWFGDMATEKNFAHLWLSEGFATYMTILYMENKYGKDTATKMLKEDRLQVIAFSKNTDMPVVDTLTTDYMQLLNANSYEKGAWVLHMLRRQLGDSVFWKSIREYYVAYAGKNAGTDDLRKTFEQVSGKNLRQFFQQWLFTAGQPQLDVKWKYIAKEKKIALTIYQKQKNSFHFPLEIQVQGASGKSILQVLNITKQTETFTIFVKENTLKVYLDPTISLLYEGSILKTE
ncbi:MAG: M1 family peptidase, partial [Bacteroidota bacterium]|nr:M1 family peptidase [Bacteroidota bacterium]